MKKWKQRLVMLLCLAMLVPMFTVAMPQDTQAANDMYIIWGHGISSYDRSVKYPSAAARIMVEQGQKFILSDYITVSIYDKNWNSTQKTAYEMKGFKYKSASSKVASINKKGVVATKKLGTTKINVTAPQKGSRPMVCTIQVVKKGSLTKKLKNSAKANTVLAKIEKYSDKKMNEKTFETLYPELVNAHKLLTKDYYDSYSEDAKGMMKHEYGLIYSKNSWKEKFHKLAMPKYGTYMRLRNNSAKLINSTKAPVLEGTSTIVQNAANGTFTLTKPLTTAQIIRLAISYDLQGTDFNRGDQSVPERVDTLKEHDYSLKNDDYSSVSVNFNFVPNSTKLDFATKFSFSSGTYKGTKGECTEKLTLTVNTETSEGTAQATE